MQKIFNTNARMALFWLATFLYFIKQSAKILFILLSANFIFYYRATHGSQEHELSPELRSEGCLILGFLLLLLFLGTLGTSLIRTNLSRRISMKIYYVLMKNLVQSPLIHCSKSLPLYIYDLQIQPILQAFDLEFPNLADTFMSHSLRIIAATIIFSLFTNPYISLIFPLIAVVNLFMVNQVDVRLKNLSRAEAILESKYMMTLGSIIKKGLNVVHAGSYEAYMKVKLDYLIEKWSLISWLKNGIVGQARLRAGLLSAFLCSVIIQIGCIYFTPSKTLAETLGILPNFNCGFSSSCTVFILTLMIIRSFMHINRTAIELKLIFNRCYEAVRSTQILKLESKATESGGAMDDSINYSSLNFTLNNSFIGNDNH
jgi:hypothetical protein